MKREQLKKAAPAETTTTTTTTTAPADGEKVWTASETFSLESVRMCGATSLFVSAGYLLRLAKSDPKCSRRDARRTIVPLSHEVHGAIWKLAVDFSAALPGETDKDKWHEIVIALAHAGTEKAQARAAAARKARAAKKSETPATETPATLDPVVTAVAALIGAISQLPPEKRAEVARRACQEISAKFE